MTSTDQMTQKEIQASLAETRLKLARNLDALEDKLNVPKQLGKASQKCRRKMKKLRDENPLAFAGVIAGAVAAVGLTGFVVVKILTKKY